MPDGKQITRKYNTAQLQKMLTDGTIAPSAKASHSAEDNFRALATYKEFQGAALSKMAKKGADKNSARTRGGMKQIAEEVRKRDEAARDNQEEDSAMTANMKYWMGIVHMVMPIGLGIALFAAVLYVTSLGDWSGSWWLPLMPGVGLVFYSTYRFIAGGR
jgi:hypothetical protein